MTLVLGVDPGAKLHGWCLLALAPGQRPRWAAAGHHDAASLGQAVRAETVGLGDVLISVVEKPAGYVHEPARGAALIETAFWAGALWQQLGGTSLAGPCHLLSPEQWRRVVCGKGTPSDAEVKSALRVRLALPARSNAHQRDACGVAWAWAQMSGLLVGGKGRREK